MMAGVGGSDRRATTREMMGACYRSADLVGREKGNQRGRRRTREIWLLPDD